MKSNRKERKGKRSASLLGLAVLCYLAIQPMHPYELSKTLRDHGDTRSVRFTHGSLYTVIGQLLRAGLITEIETSRQGARPERTVYAITDDGRRELQDWLREIVGEPAFEYPNFVTGLAFLGGLHPTAAVDLLQRRTERLKQEGAATQRGIDMALDTGVLPFFLVEEDYRVTMIEAEIEFIRKLIARITNKKNGWAPQWAAAYKQMHRSKRISPADSAKSSERRRI